MNKKKILRSSAIILTIIILFLDVLLYFKLQGTWSEVMWSNDSYKSAGLLLGSLFQFGILIYGLGLILVVWLEYFLITLAVKTYNKFTGLKKWLLFSILLTIIVALLIIIVRIFMILFLMVF